MKRILLGLLPFWDPQIPPLGIACLKSYLQKKGFAVRGVDSNLEGEFRELHDAYFAVLRKQIPKERAGNLFNIGNQVMRNHMMAHLNKTDQRRYLELLDILIVNTFFFHLEIPVLMELDDIIGEFYSRLETYLLDLLREEQPAVLGLTVYGDTLPASVFAFRLAKRRFPGIETVMGGGIFSDQLAQGSPNLEYFVRREGKYIDKIIVGEGELLMGRYLMGDLNNGQKVVGLRDIGNITMDVDTAEIPDFSDFDLRFYPYLAHYAARSCPFQCTFCSETVNWGKYRKKEINRSVAEFIELYRRHSYQVFLMTDSTLNPIVSHLAREFIDSGVSIYWDGFLRADRHVCDPGNTLLWRRGGFYRAKLGLESGSQRVLDLMNKKITLRQSEAALASLAYAGIKTTTFWLFGHPGETEEDFQQTLDFVEANKDNIYEADCNAFNYFLSGQVNSDEWIKDESIKLLYPEWATEMLVSQTWVLDKPPLREESYNRLNRFIEHCARLGVPNPYSLNDVFQADERWRCLHQNAVPALVDLKDRDLYVDESRAIGELSFAAGEDVDDDQWL
jgi:radical SAM superfamily enzyme YgiQ (UPF0313 family)